MDGGVDIGTHPAAAAAPSPPPPPVMLSADAPGITEHMNVPIAYTPFDVKWVPESARFVVLGSKPNDTGVVQVYELGAGDGGRAPRPPLTIDRPSGVKCGTFDASSVEDRHLALGDFSGALHVMCVWRTHGSAARARLGSAACPSRCSVPGGAAARSQPPVCAAPRAPRIFTARPPARPPAYPPARPPLMWRSDLALPATPVWSAPRAHASLINAIDGCGGVVGACARVCVCFGGACARHCSSSSRSRRPTRSSYSHRHIWALPAGGGAPELVTGSRDGCVRVWDVRVSDPVLTLLPTAPGPNTKRCVGRRLRVG